MKKDSKQCCYTTTPESIHTKDESKRASAFAFIFGVNWPVQWMQRNYNFHGIHEYTCIRTSMPGFIFDVQIAQISFVVVLMFVIWGEYVSATFHVNFAYFAVILWFFSIQTLTCTVIGHVAQSLVLGGPMAWILFYLVTSWKGYEDLFEDYRWTVPFPIIFQ